jgi:hypothetical protein
MIIDFDARNFTDYLNKYECQERMEKLHPEWKSPECIGCISAFVSRFYDMVEYSTRSLDKTGYVHQPTFLITMTSVLSLIDKKGMII